MRARYSDSGSCCDRLGPPEADDCAHSAAVISPEPSQQGMASLVTQQKGLAQRTAIWPCYTSFLLRFSLALLLTAAFCGCQRTEPPRTSNPDDTTPSASIQSKQLTTGGGSGKPVPAIRLQGATLRWIGNRRDKPNAFQWNFDVRTFSLLAEGSALPNDLVQLFTGSSTPRQRIDGEWHTTDGRQLELKYLPSTDDPTARHVQLTIETAGLLRVNLGDGRQYNLQRRQTELR